MFSTLTKKFFFTFSTISLVFLSGSIVRADDTEIYFTGGGLDEAVRPNVLFILDTSGSMTSTVSGTGGQQRVEVMKEAVKQVIEEVEDINVGLMRFTNDDGGPILFPITYVEENIYNVVGESADGVTIEYETTISDGLNDGVMIIDDPSTNIDVGDMNLSESQIDMDQINITTMSSTVPGATQYFNKRIDEGHRDAEQENDGDVNDNGSQLDHNSNNIVGLNFNQVNIPDNVNITNAYIRFEVRSTQSSTTNITIWGEDSNDPSFFDDCNNECFDLTSRNFTNGTHTDGTTNIPGNGSVAWNGVSATSSGDKIYTPDLTNIVQEIVSRGCTGTIGDRTTAGCTYSNDEMAFFLITSQGDRRFKSYDNGGGSGNYPRLYIEYDGPDVTTQVSNGDTQIAGLRFENIRIPKGATMTDSRLVFTPTSQVTDDTTWTITAELTPDSEEFETSSGNFAYTGVYTGAPNTRPRTAASVNWTIGTNDWEYVTVNGVTEGVAIESPSLNNIVNELVAQTNWCGGNSISFFIEGADVEDEVRAFESFEGSSDEAVKFRYSYEPTSGCFDNTESAQVGTGNDDAEQAGSVVNTIDNDLNLGNATDVGSDQTIGLRFQGIDVPQGADITEAYISFYAQGTSTGTASFTVKGIDEDDLVTFAASTDDISNRTTTTESVTWDPEDWSNTGSRYDTDDLTDIVQEIVDRGGWAEGNNMGFVIEPGSGERIAYSYNSDPARGPRLIISYSDSVDVPFKSVRESLIEVIDDLPASGNTPIQETMYEAARYWRGESMEYGDTRDGARRSRISHPGSYCTSAGNCRGAKENTGGTTPTDEFGVYTPGSCNMASNPSSSNCEDQEIEHDNNSNEAKYISPFSSDLTCANNYQVLLTDGEANSGKDESPEIEALIGKSSCYNNNSSFKTSDDDNITYSSSEDCTVDLAEFLATTDQSTASVGENLANDQVVKTYTIGFNLGTGDPTQFIKDMANLGEGNFYSADTAGQLVDVFTTILTDVKSDPTSFVSPSLATNAFNRLLSRDEVYFGLFTPALSTSWYGNMKKYNICISSDGADGIPGNTDDCTLGSILDGNGVEAIDDTDDKFKDTAQSIWSNAADGKATTQGGAGAEITDFTTQILYTDKNASGMASSGTALSSSGFKLTSATWNTGALSALRSGVCPSPSTTTNSECDDRMKWLLGKRIITDSANDISANQRWSVNDVLHSSPSVITYGGDEVDGEIVQFFDKIIYGTNDGMLHFVNGESGVEEWRYLPSEFWAQQQTQYLNAQGDHVYGLDVTPTLWTVDNDSDGKIEPGDSDKVNVFVATRRGGNYIYALDLTASVTTVNTQVVPKFLWKILGGSGSYSRLGQTWSQPQLTTISIGDGGGGTTTKEVLIFGGGYDTALDDPNIYEPSDNSNNDFMGNAIYIVDPTDGSLIMDISGAASGADIQVPDMHYSIPSRIRLMDSDGDGDTDRLYVGDTGGQVWRVDLDPEIVAGSAANTVVGLLADVSTAAATTQRRFFEPPSVVQVRDTVYSSVAEYDYVIIGSGYRAHPLNSDVEDRLYAFRDKLIATFGLPDDDGDGYSEFAADLYPQAIGPYTGAGMIDVTNSVLDSSDATHLAANGWYYDFTSAGTAAEKVLSAPTTTNGVTVFTTFKPSTVSIGDPCQGGVGDASAYNLDILSANAGLDWDGDGDIDMDDRKLALGGGIPSDVVPIFTEEGVVGIVGIEGGASQLGVLSGLPRFRTYWYEES